MTFSDYFYRLVLYSFYLFNKEGKVDPQIIKLYKISRCTNVHYNVVACSSEKNYAPIKIKCQRNDPPFFPIK